jgi:20S proteasome alpha/beta subunit
MTSIGALVENFRVTVDRNISVADASNLLAAHFQQIYQHDVSNLNWVPAPAGQLAFGFQIAGYNLNSTVGEVYSASIPPGNAPLLFNTHSPSCIWNGQIDVVSRLVLGFDPRIENLPFAQHLTANTIPGQAALGDQLRSLQYQINWHTMTLQDAIDFAILMVNSTIKMQRFSDGITLSPGDIPGCGGSIDVAVITNREGFRWIQKKDLKGEQNL